MDDEGLPQGSPCSPTLANIFAHTVIDTWFEETVKQHCAGAVAMFRYADDMVICCRYERDAQRIRKALGQRLAKYKLRLNEHKTRLVPFARPGVGRGQPGAFDFLGFTFYWGQTRRGAAVPKVKTSGKRLRVKLKRVNAWARSVRSRYRLTAIWKTFCAKVRGHIRYYAVSFNYSAVWRFVWRATWIVFKWLNRRSQRRSFTWEQFMLFVAANPLPALRIYHPLF